MCRRKAVQAMLFPWHLALAQSNGLESDDAYLSVRMIEPRPLAATRPRSAWERPYIQIHAMPWQVVVLAMYRAMHLAGLEVPVLHLLAHVLWGMVEPCELPTCLV